jgi:endonuclease YncB( thermonuclease family)
VRYDKYGGRVVARVETESGNDLGRLMIDNGLAVPYGADPGVWCSGG